MDTQAIQRTIGNVLLGAADQLAVQKSNDVVRTQVIATSAGILIGGGAKVYQVTRRDGRRHPWLDLFADTLLGGAGTVGGQLGMGLVSAKLQKANPNAGTGSTASTSVDTTSTSTSVDTTSTSTASDGDADDTFEVA